MNKGKKKITKIKDKRQSKNREIIRRKKHEEEIINKEKIDK